MKILALLLALLAGSFVVGTSGVGIGIAAVGTLVAGPVGTPAVGTSAPGTSAFGSSVWQWPLLGSGGSPPTVVRPFDPPVHRWLPGHRGVDLDARGPTQVFAAGPGTVAFAGKLFGEGVVVIEHHGVRTSYEPVDASVRVGDPVARGTPIGSLVGGHCGLRVCLHWGLLTGRGHGVRYYDPLLLFGPVRLRLEPVS
jgi:murein DD-endopeptidase MepM/ murein hydrolase activator NlpD